MSVSADEGVFFYLASSPSLYFVTIGEVTYMKRWWLHFSTEHCALTFWCLSLHTVFSLFSLFRLLLWREVVLTRLGLTQTDELVKRPSPNYSHRFFLHVPHFRIKHTQTGEYLILCGPSSYNHMSLQYSGWAKGSIIALAYAPLIKGEQYVKWLMLQSSHTIWCYFRDRH